MRIHRLRVANYRGISECALELPETGVVIVEGPNEAGKSSLAEALHLIFAYPHESRHRDVQAVCPVHVDAGPEVEVELSTGDFRFTYVKRWSPAPQTRLQVHAPVPESHTGREAHDRAREILDETLDSQLFAALHVQQGVGLQQAAFSDSPALMAALEAAAEGTRGGAAEASLLDRARAERDRHLTAARGEPKAGGPYAAALERAKAARARAEEVERAYGEIQDALAELEKVQGELDAHAAELPGLVARRDELQEQVAELSRRRALADQLAAEAQTAAAQRELADRRLQSRKEQARAIERCDRELAKAADELAERQRQRDERARALAEAEAEAERARERSRLAGAAEEQAGADVDHHERRAELAERRTRLEKVRAAQARLVELDSELAGVGVSAPALEHLEEAWEALRAAEAAAAAQRATLRVEALTALDLAVHGEVRPMVAGDVYECDVDGELVAEVPGVLRARVTAAADARSRAGTLAAAREGYERARRQAGGADRVEARRLRERSSRLEGEREQVQRNLRELLADETTPEALAEDVARREAALAGYPERRPPGVGDPPEDLAAARARRATASEELRAAEAERARVEKVVAEHAAELASIRAEAANAERSVAERRADRQQQSEQMAAERAREPDELLERALAEAADAERSARERQAAGAETVEMLAAQGLEDLLENTAQLLGRTRAERDELGRRRERLAAQVELRAADDLIGQRDEAQAMRSAAERELDRAERAAQAAALLVEVLEEHYEAARRAYREPFRRELVSLGRPVFGPDFDVSLDDRLQVAHRTLDGRTLSFEQLSGGAREQIVLLSLLACARLVDPVDRAPVIIDDALGYTDPDRLEQLAALLSRAGKDAQVLVLTCFPERFRRIGAARRVLMTDQLRRPAAGRGAPARPGAAELRPPAPGAAAGPTAAIPATTSGPGAARAAAGLGPAAAAILAILDTATAPLGRAEVLARSGLSEAAWTPAIRALVAGGWVRQTGAKRGARYTRAPGTGSAPDAGEEPVG